MKALPIWMKYTNVNAMPLGIALAMTCLYAALRLINGKLKVIDILTIAMLVAGMGCLYPFVWISGCGLVAASAAVMVLAGERRKAAGLMAALVLGCLAAAPYLRMITGARDHEPAITLARDPHLILAHLVHLGIFLAPFWLLMALDWRGVAARLRARSWAHGAVLLSGLGILLAFTLLYVTSENGYKIYGMAVLCLAPVAAPGLARIRDWNRAAFVILLAVYLLPAAMEVESKMPSAWTGVTEPFYWRGAIIRHGIPEEDELYQWIWKNTPTDAVLIDREPYAPIFAHRSLFVPRVSSRKAEDPRRIDGFLMRPAQLLEICGHPADEIRLRYEIADSFYGGGKQMSDDELVRLLSARTNGRPVFIIARNEHDKDTLGNRAFLKRVGESEGWAVFVLEIERIQSTS
jgi:hypothetical protein